jgi:SAM-dependent methyltransferase
LIEEWNLDPYETDYINRQQGTACAQCGANLRSMALALAITRICGYPGPLGAWVNTEMAARLAVLELNGAGTLTPMLRRLPGHVEAAYPQVDMLAMPFRDGSFDLVLHSDTLEHVPNPVRGLAECRRVLRVGGACCFTVPIVIGRLTRSRDGLPPSYHGAVGARLADYIVRTEYGADAWRHAMEAGFREVRLIRAEYPAALAIVAVP